MTSWLKRAEDLFEVVDRRAKLVVSELAEEQPDVPPPPDSSNEQGTKGKRTKSKAKAQKRASMDETLRKSDNKQEESDKQGSESNAKPDEMTTFVSFQNDRTIPGTSTSQTSNEQQDKMDDASVKDASSSEVFSNDGREHDGDRLEGPTMASNVEAVTLSSNHELGSDNDAPLRDADPSSTTEALGAELVHGNHDTDPAQNVRLEDADGYLKPDQEKLQSASTAPKPVSNDDKPSKHNDGTAEPLSGQAKEDSTKATSIIKVEEQLDEAQGLLKSTNPTGQSKEARLARVCAGLSSRLQEYKSENAQLEELLAAERELGRSYEDRIKQLQQELSALKTEATRVESNMAEALGAKNSEIETLVSSLDALKKQAALSEGNLASLQANMETLMRNRELTETRMMQALREELALAERRVEEEHAAHNATKKAAMQREVELEHRAVDASTALARAQRTADERAAKAAELEQKVALLEVECASLNQELQDMEGRLRREQKKSPEDPNQLIQMQAWQQEVERARHGQRDAESKLSSLEAELQKMRVEMAAMKRDAEHYSRQEHMELEKRYRELTDLLYYKQTQLETMASEKAAAEFQLEKEIKRLQEAQAEAERSKMSRRASSSWEEDTDMKELEPLPLHQRHLASASIQLRKAAKFLDTGAVRATRILWQYPTARVSLLCYLVFVHLFLMYLLHRLQEQADNFAAQEVAKSMGLSQPNLP